MNEAKKDRLFELLSDEALDGLAGEEAMELNRLKKQFPGWENDFSVELTAAAIALSDLRGAETLPANLRAKIIDSAESYFSRAEQFSDEVIPMRETREQAFRGAERESFAQTESPKTSFFGQWLGWAVAATACIALAFNLWLTQTPQTEVVKKLEPAKTPEVVQTSQPKVDALTPAQQREQLITSAADLIKTNLNAADVKSLKQFSGDVVWSNAEQKGFVRLGGLPVNDAAKETYQLWIVDGEQNEKTPVSGGVFDVGQQAGEVVVPIRAQLEIKRPKAFAVSREKPGGVVVSSPQRIVAIGKI